MHCTERTRLPLALAVALTALAPAAPAPAAPAWDYVISVNSDYDVSGRVATLAVLPPWSVDDPVATVHSDADARCFEGLVYVVNHLYGDNIQILDPEQDFATTGQFSVGPGSNPQDIEFVSATRAYVSRHESAFLYEVDPTTGAVTDTIDLSPFADADGIPEMSGMTLSGGRLFVAVQRLDRDYYWTPVPPSYLAVVDVATNELVDVDAVAPGVQGVELPVTNPYRDILVDESTGLLYVACSGNWGALDGGIVEVDPAALEAAGLVATEAQLGGELYDFTLPLEGRAHAVVSTSSPSWEQFCIAFDWSTGAKLENVWKPGGYSVMDVEVHEGSAQLFVADRTYASPGVRVFDARDGTQLTSGPLAASLPPHDLLIVGDEVASVDPAGARDGLSLSAWPNPTRGGCRVEFSSATGGRVRAAVHDVSGRLVRVLADGPLPAGDVSLAWDGRNAAGESVANGVYFVGVEAAGAEGAARVLMLR
ncbi:MAG: FlgD immunoglobulin-like domain containing protein [Candidatus Eisenbacteria bacterium]